MYTDDVLGHSKACRGTSCNFSNGWEDFGPFKKYIADTKLSAKDTVQHKEATSKGFIGNLSTVIHSDTTTYEIVIEKTTTVTMMTEKGLQQNPPGTESVDKDIPDNSTAEVSFQMTPEGDVAKESDKGALKSNKTALNSTNVPVESHSDVKEGTLGALGVEGDLIEKFIKNGTGSHDSKQVLDSDTVAHDSDVHSDSISGSGISIDDQGGTLVLKKTGVPLDEKIPEASVVGSPIGKIKKDEELSGMSVEAALDHEALELKSVVDSHETKQERLNTTGTLISMRNSTMNATSSELKLGTDRHHQEPVAEKKEVKSKGTLKKSESMKAGESELDIEGDAEGMPSLPSPGDVVVHVRNITISKTHHEKTIGNVTYIYDFEEHRREKTKHWKQHHHHHHHQKAQSAGSATTATVRPRTVIGEGTEEGSLIAPESEPSEISFEESPDLSPEDIDEPSLEAEAPKEPETGKSLEAGAPKELDIGRFIRPGREAIVKKEDVKLKYPTVIGDDQKPKLSRPWVIAQSVEERKYWSAMRQGPGGMPGHWRVVSAARRSRLTRLMRHETGEEDRSDVSESTVMFEFIPSMEMAPGPEGELKGAMEEETAIPPLDEETEMSMSTPKIDIVRQPKATSPETTISKMDEHEGVKRVHGIEASAIASSPSQDEMEQSEKTSEDDPEKQLEMDPDRSMEVKPEFEIRPQTEPEMGEEGTPIESKVEEISKGDIEEPQQAPSSQPAKEMISPETVPKEEPASESEDITREIKAPDGDIEEPQQAPVSQPDKEMISQQIVPKEAPASESETADIITTDGDIEEPQQAPSLHPATEVISPGIVPKEAPASESESIITEIKAQPSTSSPPIEYPPKTESKVAHTSIHEPERHWREGMGWIESPMIGIGEPGSVYERVQLTSQEETPSKDPSPSELIKKATTSVTGMASCSRTVCILSIEGMTPMSMTMLKTDDETTEGTGHVPCARDEDSDFDYSDESSLEHTQATDQGMTVDGSEHSTKISPCVTHKARMHSTLEQYHTKEQSQDAYTHIDKQITLYQSTEGHGEIPSIKKAKPTWEEGRGILPSVASEGHGQLQSETITQETAEGYGSLVTPSTSHRDVSKHIFSSSTASHSMTGRTSKPVIMHEDVYYEETTIKSLGGSKDGFSDVRGGTEYHAMTAGEDLLGDAYSKGAWDVKHSQLHMAQPPPTDSYSEQQTPMTDKAQHWKRLKSKRHETVEISPYGRTYEKLPPARSLPIEWKKEGTSIIKTDGLHVDETKKEREQSYGETSIKLGDRLSMASSKGHQSKTPSERHLPEAQSHDIFMTPSTEYHPQPQSHDIFMAPSERHHPQTQSHDIFMAPSERHHPQTQSHDIFMEASKEHHPETQLHDIFMEASKEHHPEPQSHDIFMASAESDDMNIKTKEASQSKHQPPSDAGDHSNHLQNGDIYGDHQHDRVAKTIPNSRDITQHIATASHSTMPLPYRSSSTSDHHHPYCIVYRHIPCGTSSPTMP